MSEPVYVKVSMWGRTDGLEQLGCVAPDDLDTRNWKIGDTIKLKVVGIRRTGWEGRAVK